MRAIFLLWLASMSVIFLVATSHEQVIQGGSQPISSQSFDVLFGSTRGSIIERGAAGWNAVPPGAAGMPWVSNGAGFDPAYQSLTNAGLANMAASTLKCRPTGLGSGPPIDCNYPSINVIDFGADPTGVANSDTAFTNALAAFPATGGELVVCGNFRTNSGIVIGNGSAAGVSTRYGVRIRGCGRPPNLFGFTGYPTAAPARIFYGGAPGGTVMKVAGPLQGWSVENLVIDAAGSANVCFDLVSGQFGTLANSTLNGCVTRGFISETVTVGGVPVTNSLNNTVENVSVGVSAANALCFLLTGTAAQNTEFTHLKNTNCIGGASTDIGYYLQVACGNEIDGWSVAGSPTVSVAFDYSIASTQPCNNLIINGQPNGTGTGWIGNSGTNPGVGALPNYLYALVTTDGALYPTLPNLVTDGGNLYGTQVGDNAQAGNVGEYQSATVNQGSAISLTSGTPVTIASLNLGSGDWEVECLAYYHPAAATSVTNSQSSVSQAPASISGVVGQTAIQATAAQVPNADYVVNTGVVRQALTGGVPVYCNAFSLFSGGTNSVYGIARARRPR